MRAEATLAYPWRYIGFLVLALLVPKLYELTSVFWVGRISLDALSIAEQFEFVSVSMEVISETATCGVLALVARRWRDHEHVAGVVRLGLLMALIGAGILTMTVLLGADHFVRTIGTPPAIAALTRHYLILRCFALPLDAAALVLLAALKARGHGREVLLLATLGVVLTALLDLVLISNTSVSLHLGILGLALGQVLGKLGLLVLVWSRFRVVIGNTKGERVRSLLKPFLAVGTWTGLDSLVRNVGYLGQLTLLNLLGVEAFGGYGLAMTVMWTALVPVLALAEATSVKVGHAYGESQPRQIIRLLVISCTVGVVYLAGVALMGRFLLPRLLPVLNPNPGLVRYAMAALRWLIGPYLCLTLSLSLKSVFFGTGHTRYLLLVSLFTNVLLIAPYVVLVRSHRVTCHFEGVMKLIWIVMAADLLLTAISATMLLRRLKFVQMCVQTDSEVPLQEFRLPPLPIGGAQKSLSN